MIKAKELRQGNKFNCDAGIKTVNGVDKFGFIYFEKCEPAVRDSRRHQSQCEPIQLTRDIIEKSGFRLLSYSEWHSTIGTAERKDYIYVETIFPREEDNNMTLEVICDFKTDAIRRIGICDFNYSTMRGITGTPMDIKYVHQLQNLFYYLTGEELNINP